MTISPFGPAPNALAIAAQRLRTGGKSTYFDDPAGFAEHCIQWPKDQGLAVYQREILDALVREKRAAVRGPHGLGKTAINAIIVLWFACTRDQAGIDWKIATTAGSWRQLSVYLWPEIHKWAYRLRPEMIGRPRFSRNELLGQNLKLNHGAAFAVASDDPQLIEGVHADSVLYLFDESKAIADATFDAAEGAFSGAGAGDLEAYAIATSTPGPPAGRFYDIHTRKPGFEDWWARHVSLQECIDAGRVDETWVNQRRAQWGETSGIYANRVLGEFHADDENGIIPLAWVEAANERWREWKEAGEPEQVGPRTVGVDVARSGNDSTVMAIRNGSVCLELRKFNKQDTMETTGIVAGILGVDPLRVAIVDVIGVGGGVVDRLRELKLPTEAFNASEGTTMKDRSGELGFANVRSAAWWRMRELLDPAYGSDIALPEDGRLTSDLTTPTWKVLSGGRIQVESKDDIKKRNNGRSTDEGDAVVQAFWDGTDHSAEQWIAYMREKAVVAAPVVEQRVDEDRETLRQRAFAEAQRTRRS